MTAVSVKLPGHAANDTIARLVSWTIPDGATVKVGEIIAVFESSKAAYEVEAPAAGFLIHRCRTGESVPIGEEIACVSSAPQRMSDSAVGNDGKARTITKKARDLMTRHGFADEDLPADADLVTSAVVQSLLGVSQAIEEPVESWEAVLGARDQILSPQTLSDLRAKMQARFHRHVPTGSLLNDRWRLARDLGFGAGASVYDESLIMGDVRVADNCWIGPFSVLDGAAAPLTIGAWTSIGAGAQIYTHHTIDRALTGGVAQSLAAATTIGACCFVSPLAVVGPGSTIGDHSFIAAHSFVQGAFPAYSYIAGAPARLVGRVSIKGASVRLICDDQN